MKLHRLVSTSLCVTLFATSAFAQLNSPDAEGYLLRARKMLKDNNPIGCVDQLSKLKSLNPTPSQVEEASLLEAFSAVKEGDVTSAAKLITWIDKYPESPFCSDATLALANIYFDARNFREALKIYNTLKDSDFASPSAQDRYYHQAYCNLELGDLEKAESLFSKLSAKGEYRVEREYYLAYIAYTKGDYEKALPAFSHIPSNSVYAPFAKYYIAQIDFVEKRFESAYTNARTLIDSKAVPEYNAEACRIAGESLFNLGRESEAIPYLKSYFREVGEDILPSTAYILGVSEYHEKNYGGAAVMFKKVTSQDDAMGQSANLYLGQCYIADGNNVTNALIAFEKAFKMNFDKEISEEALYNYAVAKSNGGRLPFGNSVGLFENFLTQYPQSKYAPEVETYILNGYMSDNDFENVLRVVDNIKNPSTTMLLAKQRALFMAGTRDYSSGRIENAVKRFAEAATMSPGDDAVALQALLWQGICMYDDHNYAGAESCFSRYLSAAGTDNPNSLLAQYDLAYSQFSAGKYAAALANFRAVTSGKAENEMMADAYSRIGDCLYYSSKFKEAGENYDLAYSQNPSAGDYPMYQQAIMMGLQKKYSDKVFTMDEMIHRFPESPLVPAALLEKAEAYTALGEVDKAIEMYNILLDDYGATAYGRKGLLQLAIARLNRGDRVEAITDYRKIISDYPTSEEAMIAIDDLKRIYAEDGNLAEFMSFISNVPDAPEVNPSELDALAFRTAEADYINDEKTDKLTKYIKDYPKGTYEPQALFYLAEASYNNADYSNALAFSERMLQAYPDAPAAEDAMLIKAESEMKLGKGEIALESYRNIVEVATGARNLQAARIGYMRTALALGENEEVVNIADALLASTATSLADNGEIKYSKALALRNAGDTDKAREIWRELAVNPADVYGARSAVALAESMVADGKYLEAGQIADEFINANPPHAYWLARGFIVLSDALRAQGETFEADEYLRSLQSNYPGNEADIFEMIEKRLK